MGQKVNPQLFKLGITRDWPTRWFTKSSFKQFLQEDEAVRKVIKEKVGQAGVVSIEIMRKSNDLKVVIKAARPGFIIGRGGKGIEELTKAIESTVRKVRGGKGSVSLSVNVEELKRSETSASYVAQQIAWDLEKRMPFRRTMKKYLEQIVQNRDVKGAKILLAGRLDGNEIARKEWLKRGSLPLQTLRADIDYGYATAFTTYGTIGIKVWVYKGEIFEKDLQGGGK